MVKKYGNILAKNWTIVGRITNIVEQLVKRKREPTN